MRVQRFSAWFLALALASRVLVPTGFMVAPLDEGWPVTLCPSQGGILFAPETGAHSAGHSQSSGHHSAAGHSSNGEGPTEASLENPLCSFGVLASAVLDFTQLVVAAPLASSDFPWGQETTHPLSDALNAALSRGPPIQLLFP